MALTQVEIQKKAVRSVAIYRQDQHLYDAFHGGVPIGFWIAMAQGESDGRMNAPGDASIGEFGIFQVTSYVSKSGKWEGTEAEFQVPKNTRKNKIGNLFLSGADFNAEAARLLVRYPGLITSYSDLYKLAHLVFAIGRGGTYSLLNRARLQPGPDVYGRLMTWSAAELKAGRLPKLGSQSPSKVAHRVVAVNDRWKVAVASGLPMSAGPPVIPSLPPSITRFTIPRDIQGHIRQLSPGEGPAVVRAADLAVWDAPTIQSNRAAALIIGGTIALAGGILAAALAS